MYNSLTAWCEQFSYYYGQKYPNYCCIYHVLHQLSINKCPTPTPHRSHKLKLNYK